MQFVLDTILSSIVVIVALLTILIFILTWLSKEIFFKSKLLNYLFSGFMILIIAFLFLFVGFFNPMYFGYGFAFKFNKILTNDQYICLVDNINSGTSKEAIDAFVFRLHTLDAQTGTRRYRKLIGEQVDVFEIEGNVLMYGSYSTLHFLDIKTGTILKTLDKHNLPSLYPEFQAGIDAINYNSNDKIIRVNVKNGKIYFVAPFSFKIVENNKESYYQKLENERINRNDSNASVYVELSPKSINSKISVLKDRQGKDLCNDLEFLEGSILARFENPNRLIVLHYTDTDKTTFIISCFTDNCKKTWEIRQQDLKANDWLNKEPLLHVYAIQNQNLLFNIGGFVCCVDTETGNIIWKNRL
jgi:hypothetical protein